MQAKFSWLLGSLCFFIFDRSTCDLHWRISKDEDNKLCSLWFFRHDNLLITSQITIKAMFILLSLVYSERAWNSKQQNVLAFYICPDTLLSITLISSLLGVIFFQLFFSNSFSFPCTCPFPRNSCSPSDSITAPVLKSWGLMMQVSLWVNCNIKNLNWTKLTKKQVEQAHSFPWKVNKLQSLITHRWTGYLLCTEQLPCILQTINWPV